MIAADALRLKALYGLDQPLFERYFAWARAALAAISAIRGCSPARC